ncbi:MAG: hypothetical protein U0Q11_11515 [Vicinamibacterales bacterium]
MRHTHFTRYAVHCPRTLVLVVASLLLLSRPASAQQSAQPAAGQAQAASPNTRVFGADAGLVLNFVKPDKTADFEAVMAKLKEALGSSTNPERRQQLAGWKIYRALEPGANGTVLYVFTIAPAVPGADYTVSTILAEAFPNDVQALYKQYAEAYASGQNIINLKLVGPPSP